MAKTPQLKSALDDYMKALRKYEDDSECGKICLPKRNIEHAQVMVAVALLEQLGLPTGPRIGGKQK